MDISKLPYTLIFRYDAETDQFAAGVQEFPGCYSCGETIGDAYQHLMDAADGWTEARLEAGLPVPTPNVEEGPYEAAVSGSGSINYVESHPLTEIRDLLREYLPRIADAHDKAPNTPLEGTPGDNTDSMGTPDPDALK